MNVENQKQRISRKQPGELNSFRIKMVFGFISIIFTFLVLRAFIIHVFPPSKENLQNIAEKQYLENIELAPYRGTIFDRRGEPLAISVKTPSFHINPRIFKPTEDQKDKISKLLQISIKEIEAMMKKKNYFVWFKRKVPFHIAQAVKDLKIDGLFEISEPARYYPTGKAASNLLGYVGTDNYGLLGIERQYEKDLRGQSIKISHSKDARGQILFLSSSNVAPEKTGNNIYLTIDRAIQEIAEDELAKGVKHAEADSGFVIVLDPHTGRILAVANYPFFDPNDAISIQIQDTKNKAFADAFEPGSILKPFVIGRAIDTKKARLGQIFDCENGVITIGRHKIRDTHAAKETSLEDILIHSSNIGTYKIAQKLGEEELYKYFLQVGLGSKEPILGFIGEGNGRLSFWKNWREINFANIAFGQGLMTTGLEVVRAYGAIANGGNVLKPILLDRIESSDKMIIKMSSSQIERKVLNPTTAKSMRQLLERVVNEGTGLNAKSNIYSIGGKTGTAQKVEPGKKAYSADKRLASFVGFAPVNDPYVVILVAIDEPGKRPYYGNLWAAPVFKQIVERTLKYLNVPPDKKPDVIDQIDEKVEQSDQLIISEKDQLKGKNESGKNL